MDLCCQWCGAPATHLYVETIGGQVARWRRCEEHSFKILLADSRLVSPDEFRESLLEEVHDV